MHDAAMMSRYADGYGCGKNEWTKGANHVANEMKIVLRTKSDLFDHFTAIIHLLTLPPSTPSHPLLFSSITIIITTIPIFIIPVLVVLLVLLLVVFIVFNVQQQNLSTLSDDGTHSSRARDCKDVA